jgi:undecaprenyl-diphosphatase
MPPSKALSPLAAWAVLSLPLFAAVAACFALFGSEEAVASYFAAWRPGHPDAVVALKLYTNWGNPALYLVYAVILARGLKRRGRGLTSLALAYLAGQLLVSVVLERLLKTAIGRPRPDAGGPFMPWSLDAAHHAMPSGHVEEITLQALPLALRAGCWLTPLGLGLVVGLMGASRVILGWHHPTDLLAGWLVGSLGGAFIQWLAPRLAARLPKHWSA